MNEDLFNYFIEKTDKRFDKVDLQINNLHKKMDKLISYKWFLTGAVICASIFMTTLFNVVHLYLLK